MDHGGDPQRQPRQVKYKPKQSRRKAKSTLQIETEAHNEATAAEEQRLLQQFKEHKLTRLRPKVEKTSRAPEVVFGFGAASSSVLKTYGNQRDGSFGNSSASGYNELSSDDNKMVLSHLTDDPPGFGVDASDPTNRSRRKPEKVYKDPWDHRYTYCPITLPIRKPNSGNPEVLDEMEFGEAARKIEHGGNVINDATNLGLTEESEKEKMFFVQLPPVLPFAKRSASAKGKEKAGTSETERGDTMHKLPRGYMGKMIVYNSGKIKLKLGDILYDVSSGSDILAGEDAAAMNTTDEECCVLGPIKNRIVITPDLDFALNSMTKLRS